MAINGRNYGSSSPENSFHESAHTSSKTLNLGKVFGVMFLWLLATAGIAFGVGYLFAQWLVNDPNGARGAMFGFMFGSAALALILTFFIQFSVLKKGKGMIIFSSLYVACMGVLLSTFTVFIDWRILGIAFGITSAIFGVLALIGMIAKNVRPMAYVGMMVLIGSLMVTLFTWLFTLFLPSTVGFTMLWILDFAIFGAMLLLIIVDMHNINKICENCDMNTNLTLYCALTLYTDFIYIFIKIVYYLAIATSRN